MPSRPYIPIPVFDTLEHVIDFYKEVYVADNPREKIKQWLLHCFSQSIIKQPDFADKDYQIALNFLYSYRGSSQTFGAYRRDLERLIQWSWFVQNKSLLQLKRDDIEQFIEFCIKPCKSWIGTKTLARFKAQGGLQVPNPEWRPFEASVSKKEVKEGKVPLREDYQFSQKALKALLAILSSFYQYCLQEEAITANPVALIRQKSKYLQQNAMAPVIRRLSNKQWQMVIGLAQEKAKNDSSQERTVFILSCLYGLYLRISELTASERWIPTMGHFFKDSQGYWWFKVLGKGNKLRQIAVSDEMLARLKYYRTTYLSLPPYPSLDEKTPLIGHVKNLNRPMTDERTIRRIVQDCFDAAAEKLRSEDPEEAQNLYYATVHWLRHTGISEDVKHRPREHVRDDAGHSSGAITDRYIDVELVARAESAKDKTISKEEKQLT